MIHDPGTYGDFQATIDSLRTRLDAAEGERDEAVDDYFKVVAELGGVYGRIADAMGGYENCGDTTCRCCGR